MPAIKCKQNNLGLGSTRRRTDLPLREKAAARRERQWLFSFETQTVDRYYILYFYNSAIVIDPVQRKEGMPLPIYQRHLPAGSLPLFTSGLSTALL